MHSASRGLCYQAPRVTRTAPLARLGTAVSWTCHTATDTTRLPRCIHVKQGARRQLRHKKDHNPPYRRAGEEARRSRLCLADQLWLAAGAGLPRPVNT